MWTVLFFCILRTACYFAMDVIVDFTWNVAILQCLISQMVSTSMQYSIWQFVWKCSCSNAISVSVAFIWHVTDLYFFISLSVIFGVNANLELVDKFCYLGDMLSVDGDADAAVENRIRIGWNVFRQLVPLLTNKDISLKVRGRLYSGCVRSSMLHGSETWPVRKENEVALQRAETRMVRWMCGVKLQDRIPSRVERETRIRWRNLGTTAKQIAMVWACVAKRRQWLGKEIMEYKVENARPRGWPKNTWREIVEIVKKDCQACGLNREDAIDRSRWMKQIRDDWWPW